MMPPATIIVRQHGRQIAVLYPQSVIMLSV